jgi:hypothetical protein
LDRYLKLEKQESWMQKSKCHSKLLVVLALKIIAPDEFLSINGIIETKIQIGV